MTDAMVFTEMEDIRTGDIGGRLRRARELKGLSLADAARLTKLTTHVLQAIERNDFGSLPGGMFRRAYVRTLATEVGLNANEVVADYCEQFEPPVISPVPQDADTALEAKWIRQLTPRPQRSLWTFAAVAAPAVAWFMLQPGPVAAIAPLDAVVSEPAAVMAPYASIAFVADPHRVTHAAAAADAPAAPVHVELTATDSCWVAAETDGERVIYRLMEPGERVRLDAQNRIVLRIGNAGAMTVSLNGAASRSFGDVGEIVNLDITTENVQRLLAGPDERLQLN
jgi:transcriptional regulator with XRE-family HTH domain